MPPVHVDSMLGLALATLCAVPQQVYNLGAHAWNRRQNARLKTLALMDSRVVSALFVLQHLPRVLVEQIQSDASTQMMPLKIIVSQVSIHLARRAAQHPALPTS